MTTILERETARAIELARESGADAYVIEGANAPPDDDEWPDIPPPTPDEILAFREHQADPEAWTASGRRPPEDVATTPEQAALETEWASSAADPVYFSARDGQSAATLVAMLGHGDLLLRIAHPDGTVEPVNDHDGEAQRLLDRYADYLASLPTRRGRPGLLVDE